jgi:glycosyltransferase involved in cell wall biosynthesis
MELLKSEFQIPESILFHLPVFPNDVIKNAPTFNEREGFLFIGNFYHEPNWDALRFLKQTVWPLIRRKLPSAELNVYGAYPSQKVYDFHNSKEGFLIHGRAENAIEVTLENRVSIAPLRFGAGIKGKLLEAMVAGTPSITTSIGAEGMASPDEWPGSVVDDPDLFAEAACSVYTDEVLWNQSQLKGYTVLENHFESDGFFKRFEMKLSAMESHLDEFRSAYFIQQLVKHQSIMSNRYLSKWIEQKNKA